MTVRARVQVGAFRPESCTPCTDNTASSAWNATSNSECAACPRNESSRAGAIVCWPGILSITASNPPPVIPSISVGDTISIRFTRGTNTPPVGTAAELSALLSFSSFVGDQLVATWSLDRTTLVIRIGSLVSSDGLQHADIHATRIGALLITFNVSAALRDALEVSQAASYAPVLVSGDWGVPKVPEFLPVGGPFAGAFARDTGGQAGLGRGDTLVLRFDNPTRQVALNTTSAVDDLLEFSSPIGLQYTAVWESSGGFARAALTITILEPTLTASNGTAVGILRVSVRLSARLTSLDESTAPSNATTVVGLGSWGDVPTATVLVRSATSLRVLLAPPAGRMFWTVLMYRVQWAADAGFSSISGTLDVPATQSETGVGVISGLLVSVPVFIRAASHVAISYKSEQLSNYSRPVGPYYAVPAPVSPTAPRVTSVAVAGGGNLMDARGGQIVALHGEYLGLRENPEYVRATYTNGNVTYTAAVCRVIDDSVEVRCSTVVGVGRGFVWSLIVDNVTAVAQAGTETQFNLPVILDVKRVISQRLSSSIAYAYKISGRDFGPVGTAVTSAWVTLPSDPRATFASPNCSVAADDSVVLCEQPNGAGAALVWTLVIGYQQSAAPTVTYDLPSIERIECDPSPCDALETVGGDTLTLHGSNYGPVSVINYVGNTFGGVKMTSQSAQVMLLNCFVVVSGSSVNCTVPPGFGVQYRAAIEVVKQTSALWSSHLSYATPTIYTIENGVYGAALAVRGSELTIRGRSFGGPSRLVLVCNCSGGMELELGPVAPSADHRTLVYSIPLLPRAFVGWRTVGVLVDTGGIRSSMAQVAIAPPVLQLRDAIAVEDAQPAVCRGVHADWWLVIAGAELGIDALTTSVVLSSADGGDGVTLLAVCAVSATGTQVWVGANATAGTVSVIVRELVSNAVRYSLAELLADPTVTALVLGDETGIIVSRAATAGGSVLHVVGTGFHRSYTAFLVPRALQSVPMNTLQRESLLRCEADLLLSSTFTSNSFDCTLPPGIGTGLRFILFGRGHFIATFAFVGYSPPSVDRIAIADGSLFLTSGGGAIVVTGLSFGNWSENVTVTVDGRLCDPTAPVTNSKILCRAPPGDAPDPEVVISVGAQQYHSKVIGLAYRPPTLRLISPNSSSTAGGRSAIIIGDNFGIIARPRVTFLLPVPLSPVDAHVVSYTASLLEIIIPAGAGGGSNVSNLVGIAVENSAQRVEWKRAFSYDAPYIASVRPVGACPVTGCGISISGGNFGTKSETTPSVVVNGIACPVVSSTHREVVCSAPPGAGSHNTVAVTVLGRTANSNASFAYDPPEIVGTIPRVADQSVVESLLIIGRNFYRAGLVILVSGLTCNAPAVYINETAVLCPKARYINVGIVSVSVVVQGQSSRLAFVEAQCRAGYFGRISDIECKPCPLHALCAGYDQDPVSASGYWGRTRTLFVECIPQKACIEPETANATSQCGPAYTGALLPGARCIPRVTHARTQALSVASAPICTTERTRSASTAQVTRSS